MVGRGWWCLVWTVYTACMVDLVCGGLSCQQGQEFYSSQQGRCVPCTRCHVPQVVVLPCYIYQDAVCASAAQFLPNWSQPTQPQSSTLSTPTAAENATEREQTSESPSHNYTSSRKASGRQAPEFSSHNYTSSNRKTSGHHRGNDRAPYHKNKFGARRHGTPRNRNDSKKKGRSRHHHHHHRQQTEQNAPVLAEPKESVVSSVTVSQRSDASQSVSEDGSELSDGTGSSVSDCESLREDICDGANSNKDSELPEPETTDWQTIFFLIAIIVITICAILLLVCTVSHLRSVFTRWKLDRVCDAVPEENNGEMTVMEHLLTAVPTTTTNRTATAANRAVTSYARSTSSTPIPSSSAITASGVMVDSERTNGHVYPPIPFTMDRLLEQRRVLGPASSVDTNLYIESWQQQDSHTAAQHPPSISPNAGCRRTFLTGSVSACPSPVPVRTYRLGPASSSASPIIPARGLGPMQGRARGVLASPVYALSGSTGGVAISGCASVAPT